MEFEEAKRAVTATEAMMIETRNDMLMRNLIFSSVARAQQEFGAVDPERADSDASRIAELACLILFTRMRENMDGLEALIQQRDQYRKVAENSLAMATRPIVISADSPWHPNPKAEG